jgi:hypothetical protein
MFVYSDISKHQVVGDVDAPLLGIVPVSGAFGSYNHFGFSSPPFVGINKSHITEIRIFLMTDTGKPVAFLADSSSVICTLRFRRRKDTI